MRQEAEYRVDDRVLCQAFLLEQLNQDIEERMLLFCADFDRNVVIDQSGQRHKTLRDDLLNCFMDELLLNEIHVLQGGDFLVDDKDPHVAPDGCPGQCMLDQEEVFCKPLDRSGVEPDLGVTVLIVVHIDCSVDEVRWQLTYVDGIQLLVLRDNHVFNYEWHVALRECFFVDCDANFLLAKAVLAA